MTAEYFYPMPAERITDAAPAFWRVSAQDKVVRMMFLTSSVVPETGSAAV